MDREDLLFLQIAAERGYLAPHEQERVQREARARGCTAEQAVRELNLLSARRLERLLNHVEYRVQRRADKALAEALVRHGRITRGQAEQALREQRRAFEADRVRIRLGSYLAKFGLIAPGEEESLRRALLATPRSPAPARVSSPADATLPLAAASGSAPPRKKRRRASYRAIEEAIDRVDSLRRIQNDLSTSDPTNPPAVPDSAAEFENACNMLARRRLPPAEERPARERGGKKKTTSAFRVLFGLGAA